MVRHRRCAIVLQSVILRPPCPRHKRRCPASKKSCGFNIFGHMRSVYQRFQRALVNYRTQTSPFLISALLSRPSRGVSRLFVLECKARRGGVSGEIAAAILEPKLYILSARDQKRRLEAPRGRGSECCREDAQCGGWF